MNRLEKLFSTKKRDILSIFYTAGFPKLDDTALIAEALEKSGVDLIEIGIPFSDPVADGPVIQQSNKTALDNGMTLPLLLQQVTEIRTRVNIPVILMGYLNPVLQYGMDRFVTDAMRAGVDGVILPDLPVDIYETQYRELFREAGLPVIFLIAPTTPKARIRKIDALSDSFIYAVSASNTTGNTREFSTEQLDYFKRLAAMKLRHPFLVGFGISNHLTFVQACEHGAGAIVGSAFIRMLNDSPNIKTGIKTFVPALRPLKIQKVTS